MTFKHVKFEDSPTMRALEKVAREKGLVKPEPLEKKASAPKKADYTPTYNLMENVLKLCSGLRNQGLVKEAAELETNYLNYKRAQTLYETSKETGEDLLHAAHPDGSHKMEGVEGDATVEDLLEKHLKHVQMVEKKPTGKLSTAEAISEVRKIFAQNLQQWTPSEIAADWEKYPDKWKNYVFNQMVDKMWAALQEAASGQAAAHVLWKQGRLKQSVVSNIGETLQKANNAFQEMRNNKEVTVDGLRKMISAFEDVKGIAEGSVVTSVLTWGIGGEPISDQGTRDKIVQAMDQAKGTISGLITTAQAWAADQTKLPVGITAPKKPASSEPVTIKQVDIAADPVLGLGVTLINRLKQYSGLREVSTNAGAANWIREEIKQIQSLMKGFNDSSSALGENEELDPGVRSKFMSDMNEKKAEVDDFYRQIMGQ